MGGYSKAITAIVGGVITLLANFGVDVGPGILNMINALVPMATAVLVYLIPNKAPE